MANRLTRRVRPLIALAALAGTAMVVPTLAHAAPRTAPHRDPSVSSVQKRLGDLAVENSQLVEKFDQAQVTVGRREKAAAAATRAAGSAARAYASQHAQFVQLIQAQYEGSSMGSTAALLDSDSDSNYLDRLATLDMVSSNTAQLVRQVHRSQADAQAASARATTLLATARSERAALKSKKAAVQKQIDKYKALLDTLTARQRATYANANKVTASPKQVQHLTAAGTGAARIAVQFALDQLGKPYVFGAAGPGSYDCSGLTMRAWGKAGVNLPHSAAGQYDYGHHVSRSDLQPGDLIFLYRPIGHVEIYIGNGMAVSAPTEGEPVQIVSVAHNGSDYTGATRLT